MGRKLDVNTLLQFCSVMLGLSNRVQRYKKIRIYASETRIIHIFRQNLHIYENDTKIRKKIDICKIKLQIVIKNAVFRVKTIIFCARACVCDFFFVTLHANLNNDKENKCHVLVWYPSDTHQVPIRYPYRRLTRG